MTDKKEAIESFRKLEYEMDGNKTFFGYKPNLAGITPEVEKILAQPHDPDRVNPGIQLVRTLIATLIKNSKSPDKNDVKSS